MSSNEEPVVVSKTSSPLYRLLAKLGPYIILLLTATVEWRYLISTNSIIGVHWDWSLPFYKYQMFNSSASGFSAYSYLLASVKPDSFNLYFNFLIFGLLSRIPISVPIFEDAMLIGFSFLSGASMFLLVSEIKQRCLYFDLISSTIYMFSPLIFYEMVEGHYGFLFSYSLLPLIFYLTWKLRETPRILSRELFLLVVLLCLFQTEPYFLFFYPVIVLILLAGDLFTRQPARMVRLIAKFSISMGLYALTNLYLIYTIILSVIGHPLYGQLVQLYSLLQSTPALNYFFLNYVGNNSFFTSISSFERLWLYSATCLLCLTFVSLLIPRLARSRPLSLIMILGYGLPILFLIPWVSNFLYTKSPILVFFHDTVDYLILVILIESVLLSMTLGYLRRIAKGLNLLLLAFVIFLLVFVYVYPFLSGDFTGNISTYTVPNSYLPAETLLESNRNYSNAWLPLFPAQSSSTYLTGGTAYNPMQTYSSNTFDWWQQPLPYYVESLMTTGDAQTASPLLGLFSVKYIAAPTELSVPMLSSLDNENIYNYAALLSSANESYSSVFSSSELQVFNNKPALPLIFGQSSIVTFAGSFNELGLFENAVMTLSGYPLMTSFPFDLNTSQTMQLLAESDWIVGGQNYSSYLLSQLLPLQYTYSPATQSKITGDWLNIASIPYLPASLISSPYSPEISTGQSSMEITTSIGANQSGAYTLMMYVYEGPTGSSLNVQIGGQNLAITTLSSNPDWVWRTFNVSSYQNSSIEVSANTGTNAIARVVLVPDSTYQSYSRTLATILSSKKVIHISSLSNYSPQMQELINNLGLDTNLAFQCNAQYTCSVNVPNTVRVVFFTLSSGPYWRIESKTGNSDELNGLGMINGWIIPLNSQNEAIFQISLSVQDGYFYCVLISVFSALSLLILSATLYYREKKVYAT